MRKMKLIKVN